MEEVAYCNSYTQVYVLVRVWRYLLHSFVETSPSTLFVPMSRHCKEDDDCYHGFCTIEYNTIQYVNHTDFCYLGTKPFSKTLARMHSSRTCQYCGGSKRYYDISNISASYVVTLGCYSYQIPYYSCVEIGTSF